MVAQLVCFWIPVRNLAVNWFLIALPRLKNKVKQKRKFRMLKNMVQPLQIRAHQSHFLKKLCDCSICFCLSHHICDFASSFLPLTHCGKSCMPMKTKTAKMLFKNPKCLGKWSKKDFGCHSQATGWATFPAYQGLTFSKPCTDAHACNSFVILTAAATFADFCKASKTFDKSRILPFVKHDFSQRHAQSLGCFWKSLGMCSWNASNRWHLPGVDLGTKNVGNIF